MKLVDLDKTVVQTLANNGYTHALIMPLARDEANLIMEDDTTLKVIPFHDFGEASMHLDSLEEDNILKCVIVEMDSKLADRSADNEGKFHLLIDVDSVELQKAS